MKELYLNYQENVKDGFLGDALKNFTQLKCAGFGGTGINGQCINFLSNTVSELYLWDCKLDEKHLIVNFERLTGLKIVDLGNTNIKGMCIPYLSENLEELNIGGCSQLEYNYLSFKKMKKLKRITLSNVKNINEYPTTEYLKIVSFIKSKLSIAKSTEIKFVGFCNSLFVLPEQKYDVLGINLDNSDRIFSTPDVIMGLLPPDKLDEFSEDFGFYEFNYFQKMTRKFF